MRRTVTYFGTELEIGSQLMELIFRGRDNIFKSALFNRTTKQIIEIIKLDDVDQSIFRALLPNQVVFIYSTVMDSDSKYPLENTNGRIAVKLDRPFWEGIEGLIGEQLEHMTDFQAVKSVSKILFNLGLEVKKEDPTIELMEKSNRNTDILTN